jgi:hypothetical protein
MIKVLWSEWLGVIPDEENTPLPNSQYFPVLNLRRLEQCYSVVCRRRVRYNFDVHLMTGARNGYMAMPAPHAFVQLFLILLLERPMKSERGSCSQACQG